MSEGSSTSFRSYNHTRNHISSPNPSERFRAIYDATEVPSSPSSTAISPRLARSASLNHSKINSSTRRAPSPPLPPLPPPTTSHPARSHSVSSASHRNTRSPMPTRGATQNANKMPAPSPGPRMAIPSLRAKLGTLGKLRKSAQSKRDTSTTVVSEQMGIERRYIDEKPIPNGKGDSGSKRGKGTDRSIAIEEDWSYVDARSRSPSSSTTSTSNLAEWKIDSQTGQRILVYTNSQESRHAVRPSRSLTTATSSSARYEISTSSPSGPRTYEHGVSYSPAYPEDYSRGRDRYTEHRDCRKATGQREVYVTEVRRDTDRNYSSPKVPSESFISSSSTRHDHSNPKPEQRNGYSYSHFDTPTNFSNKTHSIDQRKQASSEQSFTQSSTYVTTIEPQQLNSPKTPPSYTPSRRQREKSQPPAVYRNDVESNQERNVHRRTGTDITSRSDLPSTERMGRYGIYASPTFSLSSEVSYVATSIEGGRSDSVQALDRTPRSTRPDIQNVVSIPSIAAEPYINKHHQHQRYPQLVSQTTKDTDIPSQQITKVQSNQEIEVEDKNSAQLHVSQTQVEQSSRKVNLHTQAAPVNADAHPLANDSPPTPKLQPTLSVSSLSNLAPALAAAFASAKPVSNSVDEDGNHVSAAAASLNNVVSNESSKNVDENTGADTVPGTSSPLGALQISLLRGTEAVWGKLFGGGKDKGHPPAQCADANTTNSESNGATPESNDPVNKSDSETETEIEGARDVMLYSPLIPSADSLVEVAQSEVVTLYEDDGNNPYGSALRERAYRAELRRRWADGRGFISFDTLSTFESLQEEDENRPEPTTPQGIVQDHQLTIQGTSSTAESTLVNPGDCNKEEEKTEDDSKKKGKAKERIIWRPSQTQLSVQVLWWGYRIYLPPPVLAVLNSRSLEAAKRTTLISGALTWMVENIPMSLLPPPLAPAALLLKGLVPVVGAIGTFIAWSWKAIVTFDRGNGVVLSATWLMPIILVPGTWEDDTEALIRESERMPDGLGVEQISQQRQSE